MPRKAIQIHKLHHPIGSIKALPLCGAKMGSNHTRNWDCVTCETCLEARPVPRAKDPMQVGPALRHKHITETLEKLKARQFVEGIEEYLKKNLVITLTADSQRRGHVSAMISLGETIVSQDYTIVQCDERD